MSTFAKLDPNYAVVNNCDPCNSVKNSPHLAGATRYPSDGVAVGMAKIVSPGTQYNSYDNRLNSVINQMNAVNGGQSNPVVAKRMATGYAAGTAIGSQPTY